MPEILPRLAKLVKTLPWWLGLPVLVTLGGLLPAVWVNQSTLLMMYLMAVLFCSLKVDMAGLVLSALFSLLLFNYFHTDPLHSLAMNDPGEFVSALLFIAFAALAGSVSLQLRRQSESLSRQSDFLRAQVDLGERLQHAEREEEILPLLDRLAREQFGQAVAFRLLPPRTSQNPDDTWHLTWVLQGGKQLDQERQAMLLSIKEQMQAVLDRLSVARALQRAERRSDEERLRGALLSSISHDLRTPLKRMTESAQRLKEDSGGLSDEESWNLLDSVVLESRRLEAYVQNLLDMTRLGHGALPLSRGWIDFGSIHREVMRRIDRHWPSHRLSLRCDEELPRLHVHADLIGQALFHAIDNALKAGGRDQEVLMEVRAANDKLVIRVCDRGPGLPQSQWEAVFDQFYTYQGDERFEKGTGLGLSICRSIFRVHGGDARIVPPSRDFHHCLQMTLPIEQDAE